MGFVLLLIKVIYCVLLTVTSKEEHAKKKVYLGICGGLSFLLFLALILSIKFTHF